MGGDTQQDAVADWEQCKENAMPIKRGRDVKKLQPLGGKRDISSRKDKLERERESFEEALVSATSDGDMEDPLAVWIKYIKWLQDNFPSGDTELLALLERCTRQFKDDERYRNNEKYLKVWIGYADRLHNPTMVFKYLRENKIGDKLALYYVATAWAAEHRGNFSIADKAYTVGLEKKAAPLELLKKRQREFQRRMSRRWLDQAEKERNGEVDPDQDEQRADAEASRARSLQPISRSEAASMHRPIGNSRRTEMMHPNVSGRAVLGGNSNSNETNAQKDKASRFEVFEQRSAQTEPWRKDDWGDENDNDEGNDDENRRGTAWKNLAGVKELQKENSIDPAPWTHQGFGPGTVAPRRQERTRGQDGSEEGEQTAFDVYVEEGAGGIRSPRAIEKGESSAGGLKMRSKVDESETEMLMKKPLQNFGKERAPQTTRTPAVKSKPSAVPGEKLPVLSAVKSERGAERERACPEEKKQSNSQSQLQSMGERTPAQGNSNATAPNGLDRADQEDMTINTRLALDDMFEMFGSPSMKSGSDEKQKKSVGVPAVSVSTVDTHNEDSSDDENDDDERNCSRGGSDNQSRNSGGAGVPFSIFNAEESPVPKHESSKPSKPFSVFDNTDEGDLDVVKDEPRPSKPFSIFGAEDETEAPSKAAAKPFSIFGAEDETEAPSKAAAKPFSIFGAQDDVNEEDEQSNRIGGSSAATKLMFKDDSEDDESPSLLGGGITTRKKPFSIFKSDSPSKHKEDAPKARKPFQMFGDDDDEDDAPVVSTGGRKPFSIFAESSDDDSTMSASRNKSASSKPFSIFGDSEDAEEIKGASSRGDSKARKPFSIFSGDDAHDSENSASGAHDDSTLSFAPLEAILEANGETDESVMSSMSRTYN